MFCLHKIQQFAVFCLTHNRQFNVRKVTDKETQLYAPSSGSEDKEAPTDTGSLWAEIGVCISRMELADGRASEHRGLIAHPLCS